MSWKVLIWLIAGFFAFNFLIISFIPNETDNKNNQLDSTCSVIQSQNTSQESFEEKEELFLVTYVVDGDTFDIETGERD